MIPKVVADVRDILTRGWPFRATTLWKSLGLCTKLATLKISRGARP